MVYRLWESVVHMHATGVRSLHIFPTEFVQEGVKKVLLTKRHTQQKLAASMGVSKTTVHCWIVVSTIHIHCNSLIPILTEKNKWARLEMTLHFRDPKDPTKYQDA